MAKTLNPMPPSAKAASRTLWVQAVVAVVAGGGLVAAHHYARSWVPAIAADNVYRAAVGLGVGALGLVLLTILLRRQWRWLWVVTLLLEAATIAGLVWLVIKGFTILIAAPLALLPIITLCALLARVSRRWFHH